MTKFRLLLLAIFIFCFAALPALASDCTAPVLLYELHGNSANSFFGFSVAAIGDLNDDGKSDFIVGEPNASPDGISNAGAVYIYSGADGTLLRQIKGDSSVDYLGQSVSGIGDVDNDGKPDFLVGAPTVWYRTGYVSAYSGGQDSLLFQINFPGTGPVLFYLSLAGVGDVNGDGGSDFIIGLPNNNPNNDYAGSVLVYSGLDGSFLYQIDGTGLRDQFGFSVAGMGDITSDGRADFLVGALNGDTSYFGNYWNGSANVYSGGDSSLILQQFGDKPRDYLGWSIAVVGDLDGDGKRDFIAGAPFQTGGPDAARPSYVKAYSSLTGEILFEKTSSPTDRLGFSVSGLSDVNGDGIPDFMVGAPGGGDIHLEQSTPLGAVYVYSGADGTAIYQIKGSVSWDNFGASATGAGDLNDDGKEDIIVGAHGQGYPIGDSGTVYVFVSKTVPKGDLDFDSTLTIADIANLLNVVFVDNSSAISPCTADLNCDGAFAPGDVVLLLNRVFLQTALPCS